MIGFFSLLILSAGVGVYLFLAVSGGDVFAPHAPALDEEGPFSVEAFANLDTLYQEKEARLEALLATPPARPSDPSQ
ncbi:MAG: hypothetical protein HY457_01440 [Parcubacteria group bacterium]|nr:hypothetical protein [Parcubacteria group bacterium]